MVLKTRARAAVVLLLMVSWLGFGVVPAAQAIPGRALPVAGEEEWWFTAWQVEKVWATGARGQGVTVAVIDSGVNASEPALKGRILPGMDPGGGKGWSDSDGRRGHGTQMARFIVGQGGWGAVGVAPEAKILPITHGPDLIGLGDNIRYAVDHGAKVINMSIASFGSCDSIDSGLPSAVRYAIDRGAILFAGSGNDGRALNNSPADCPGVVSVAAVDSKARMWSGSTSSDSVALAAPGTQMPSLYSDGERGLAQGTSDATALTSGAAALVWSRYPDLTNRQVVARLLATARDIGPRGRDASSGFGIARPLYAITASVPADAPNPVFDELDQAVPATAAAMPSSMPVTTAPSSGRGRAGGSLVWVGVAAGVAVVIFLVLLLVRRSPGGRVPSAPAPGYPAAEPLPGQWPPVARIYPQPDDSSPPPGQWPSSGSGPDPGS